MRAVGIFAAVLLQALAVSQHTADARGLHVAQDITLGGSPSLMAANPQLRSTQDDMQARASDFDKVVFEGDPEPAAAPNDTSATAATPAGGSESVAAGDSDDTSATAATPAGGAESVAAGGSNDTSATAATPAGGAESVAAGGSNDTSATAATPAGGSESVAAGGANDTSSAPASTSRGDVAGGGDDGIFDLIGDVTPEAEGAVSLLADAGLAASNSLPWTFKLGAASPSLTGRELVGMSGIVSNQCKNGAIKVLVVVSTCFETTAVNMIKAWADALEAVDTQVFPPTNNVVLKYKFTKDGCPVPGCWNPNSDDIARNAGGNYDVLVSVLVQETGKNPVQAYIDGVNANNKPTLVGFVYKGPKTYNSNTHTSIDLPTTPPVIAGYEIAEWSPTSRTFLTRANAVKTLSMAHCSAIPGSEPKISTVSGKRQCSCGCPPGYELSGNTCQKKTPVADECACAWAERTAGYSFSVTSTGSSCAINQLVTKNVLPAPVARDNYVGYLRDNTGDSSPSATSPRIELSLAKQVTAFTAGPNSLAESAYSPNPVLYSWKTFRETSPIDAIIIPKVGRYKIEMKAVDYTSEAQCAACVVVLDNVRPTPTTSCPAASITATLGLSDISTAKSAMSAVKSYQSLASNDACSDNVRCDVESLQVKRFAADTPDTATNSVSGADNVFDTNNVKTDLWAQLQKLPLKQDNTEQPWTKCECKRCATASVALKEWYAPYTCSALSVAPTCVGTAACAVTRCVEAKGSTIASATASTTETVQTASLNVLKGKVENKALTDSEVKAKFPNLDKNVHLALPECTTSTGDATNPKCKTTAKVSDLLTVSSSSLWSTLTDTEVRSIVSWRYKVGASTTWSALSTSTGAETFSMDSTSITVQAWTTCGMINEFIFIVHLHINTDIKVCESFREMWYPGTFVPAAPVDEFCMHENSDFAVATFDFDAATGLPASTGFVAAVSGVKCSISYGAVADGVEVLSYPASGSTDTGFDITEEIAIGGATKASTQAMTTVKVTCDFTYKHTVNGGSTPITKSCDRNIKIKDCTPPKISKPCPFENECTYDKCAKSGSASPDIKQACGGKRVSQGANQKAQFAATATSTCCASCTTAGFTTSCMALDGMNTKRCEVVKVSTGTIVGLEAAVDDLASNVMSSAHTTGSLDATSALLGASAMVAVVALIIVRRRRAAAERAVVEEDAYYPLMG